MAVMGSHASWGDRPQAWHWRLDAAGHRPRVQRGTELPGDCPGGRDRPVTCAAITSPRS